MRSLPMSHSLPHCSSLSLLTHLLLSPFAPPLTLHASSHSSLTPQARASVNKAAIMDILLYLETPTSRSLGPDFGGKTLFPRVRPIPGAVPTWGQRTACSPPCTCGMPAPQTPALDIINLCWLYCLHCLRTPLSRTSSSSSSSTTLWLRS